MFSILATGCTLSSSFCFLYNSTIQSSNNAAIVVIEHLQDDSGYIRSATALHGGRRHGQRPACRATNGPLRAHPTLRLPPRLDSPSVSLAETARLSIPDYTFTANNTYTNYRLPTNTELTAPPLGTNGT